MGLGFSEILLIVAIVLLLFGAKKIPELARALGRASHEFKKAKEDLVNETKELTEASEKKAAAEDTAKKEPAAAAAKTDKPESK
ncbi:MAG: Sec-independent protein translocase protein TatAd [Lentisphaerae bacterium ADurb.Bin242]|nr:MAG: Sec-independent protein translocase protein TatAd [Lentisphaerae bacterium ADurb.Bin242]